MRCWFAPRDVLPERPYAEALIDAINESWLMVLVFSSSSNGSDHVIREVERAASKGIPILPLRIEDVAPNKSMEFFIGATHWLDAISPPLERHLDQLTRTVLELLPARQIGTRAAEAPVGSDRVRNPPGTLADHHQAVGGRPCPSSLSDLRARSG